MGVGSAQGAVALDANSWGCGTVEVGEGTKRPYDPDSLYYPSYPESWRHVSMGWVARTFALAVAADATVDLGGNKVAFTGLSGAGKVTNGSVEGLTYAYGDKVPTFDGPDREGDQHGPLVRECRRHV